MKAIRHGTEAGYKMHRRRGEVACVDCRSAVSRRARERYWADPERHRQSKREAEQREAAWRRRGTIQEVLVDHLETLAMVWGERGVPGPALLDSVMDRHPDLIVESVRRTLTRMVVSGRAESGWVVDEWRYRLT